MVVDSSSTRVHLSIEAAIVPCVIRFERLWTKSGHTGQSVWYLCGSR